MIISFKSKALKKLFLTGDASRLNPNHVKKVKRILLRLNNTEKLEDMNVPAWRLHKLKGNLAGLYAVDVSGNFRITFRFENSEVSIVDYIDYH